jgi:hypothetical protein
MSRDDGGSPGRSVTGKLLSSDPSPSLKVSCSQRSIHHPPPGAKCAGPLRSLFCGAARNSHTHLFSLSLHLQKQQRVNKEAAMAEKFWFDRSKDSDAVSMVGSDFPGSQARAYNQSSVHFKSLTSYFSLIDALELDVPQRASD